jgi:hypothetical protein
MRSNSRLDAIVKRFPGPVRLTPSRGKWLLILLVSAVFTIGAVHLIHTGSPRVAGDPRAWLGAVLFGFGVLASIIMLLPGAGGLVLDGDGFAVTKFYRIRRYRWADAGGFTVWAHRSNKVVVFDSRTAVSSRLVQINTKLTGRNSGLPDTYGLKAATLAELMSRWRERALR